MNKRSIGSDFDDFLKQVGLLAECEAGALKRVVAWQIEREIKADTTRTLAGEGFKRPWPPLIKMEAAVKSKVEKLFNP